MFKTYILYKPFNVLSQFTAELEGQLCLKDIIDVENDVYAVGRLDYDSEGLLLLTNDKKLNALLLGKEKISKTYYVQVEGNINEEAIEKLKNGVSIKLPNKSIYNTLPCEVRMIREPNFPQRNPPIRERKNIPTSWASITLTEGKNRQVRKMFAAVNFPVLRLVRYSLGKWTIEGFKSGEIREIKI